MKNNRLCKTILKAYALWVLASPFPCISEQESALEAWNRRKQYAWQSRIEKWREDTLDALTKTALSATVAMHARKRQAELQERLDQLERIDWLRSLESKSSRTGVYIANDYTTYYYQRFFAPLQGVFRFNRAAKWGLLTFAAYTPYRWWRENKRMNKNLEKQLQQLDTEYKATIGK